MKLARVPPVIFFFVFLPVGALAQAVPRKEAVEAFRIGGMNAPEYAAFVREPAIVASSDGTIFLRSRQPPALVVFDSDGQYLRTIGGEGEGPGEFRVPLTHGLLGDTLWVVDIALLRVCTFLTDGTHVRTWRLEPIDLGVRLSAPQTITALLEGPYALAVPTGLPQGVGRTELPVLVGDRAFQESQTVLKVVKPQGLYVEGVASFALAPFPIPPLVAVAGNGSGLIEADWEEEGGGLTLTRYGPSGGIEWTRQLQSDTEPVSREVRDSLISEGLSLAGAYLQSAQRRGTLGRGSLRDVVADGLPLPTHFPPASQVRLGLDGSVWIRSGGFQEPADWTVLDAHGELRFKVQLPGKFRLQDATLRTVWGSTVDALDIPYVVRYDIR